MEDSKIASNSTSNKSSSSSGQPRQRPAHIPSSEERKASSLSKSREITPSNGMESQNASETEIPQELLPFCVEGIPGLVYYPNFITEEEEQTLLEHINGGVWDTVIKRRVQHFGLRYDYSLQSIDRKAEVAPLPSFVDSIASRIHSFHLFPRQPDQCIVNEYIPGQGIFGHIDKITSFGPVVASLSLGSDVIMSFTLNDQQIDVPLERRSIAFLTGPARYQWKHGIAQRKSDVINGRKVPRGVRVSMTFRTVLLDG